MQIKYILGKRFDSRGRVELSVRLRCGSFDRQTGTFIRVEWCDGMTVDTLPPKVVKLIRALTVYIEESWWESRNSHHPADWLVHTVASFRKMRCPRAHEDFNEIATLIDDYLEATDTGHFSKSRYEGYALLRRSVVRFEAWKQLKFPRFSFTVGVLDIGLIGEFERFLAGEHRHVRDFPSIAEGEGCRGRTMRRCRNTVNDRMKLLRAVVRWGMKCRRISYNPFYNYVSSRNLYGTPFYLSLEERRVLERHDFSSQPRLAAVRDLFVFQCCVGCRVSDLMNLTRANIVDGELHYVARKTREGRPMTIKVPLNRTALRILARYKNAPGERLFPMSMSRITYNTRIKHVMRRAGLSRIVVVLDPISRESRSRRLWEVASSQMARRTFIGNIYKRFKDQGLVSELSGHAPGSNAFSRYREIDPEMKREMVKAIE